MLNNSYTYLFSLFLYISHVTALTCPEYLLKYTVCYQIFNNTLYSFTDDELNSIQDALTSDSKVYNTCFN